MLSQLGMNIFAIHLMRAFTNHSRGRYGDVGKEIEDRTAVNNVLNNVPNGELNRRIVVGLVVKMVGFSKYGRRDA